MNDSSSVAHAPELIESARPSGREFQVELDGAVYTVYSRLSEMDSSIAVFVPGGGHNGRIAYGHGSTKKEYFLDYWLNRQNIGLIALSHAQRTGSNSSGLSLNAIADAWSQVVFLLASKPRKPVVIVGWSAAGRIVNPLIKMLLKHGLKTDCFISLAATPPFPGLVRSRHDRETQSSPGIWEAGDTEVSPGILRKTLWQRDLRRHLVSQNCLPLSEDDYFNNFLQSAPMALRAEPLSSLSIDTGNAITSMSTFDWESYPVCGCVVPDSAHDPRHALSDTALWGTISVQSLTARLERSGRLDALSAERWSDLVQAVDALPLALRRRVPGGHFFFVGDAGAKRTAQHIRDIKDTIGKLLLRFPELQLDR